MAINPILISNVDSAKEAVTVLLAENYLGLDCEGVNLGLTGQVTLIQIVTSGLDIYLFDVLVCPEIATILKPVLESETIVKIIHDCRGDRANLLKDYDIKLGPVFDTQIAYKFINTRTELRVGWNKLCQIYKLESNPLKEKFHGIYKTNPAIWKERPLTRDMMIYASADVRQLHELRRRMSQQIPLSKHNAFEKMCESAILKEGEPHSNRF